jgi:hypothetical protein
MIYNSHPKYEILQNKLIDFATMQSLRRFAKYWDLIGNSGNFIETTPLIWGPVERDSVESKFPSINEIGARETLTTPSPFSSFVHFSEWLYQQAGRTDGIALLRLMEWLFEFLITGRKFDARLVAGTLWRDYQRGGRHDKPLFLRKFLTESDTAAPRSPSDLPRRQARHLEPKGF